VAGPQHCTLAAVGLSGDPLGGDPGDAVGRVSILIEGAAETRPKGRTEESGMRTEVGGWKMEVAGRVLAPGREWDSGRWDRSKNDFCTRNDTH